MPKQNGRQNCWKKRRTKKEKPNCSPPGQFESSAPILEEHGKSHHKVFIQVKVIQSCLVTKYGKGESKKV
jgi:hypothetical protein